MTSACQIQTTGNPVRLLEKQSLWTIREKILNILSVVYVNTIAGGALYTVKHRNTGYIITVLN